MTIRKIAIGVSMMAVLSASTAVMAAMKPTIVLVHGAFADSTSWNGVIKILEHDGYTVVAAANPLRSLKGDAESVAELLNSIQRPIVLVGHSYGGPVISQAAYGQANVKALVYVAAFAPDAGESAVALTSKFPGGTLENALSKPVELTNGDKDLYIKQNRFHDQFAADLSAPEAKLMAATQRPITNSALNEAASEPAWKNIPSWWIYGDKDRNIPAEAIKFMAERAKSKATVVVKGASHVVMVSNPKRVARLIETAASYN